jgi:hypothetical protein
MRRSCISGVALLLLASMAVGSTRDSEPVMEVVLVTGEQPGPALWKVSSGEHLLWILGEVSPLPRKVKWRSKQFENLLANSQEVLLHSAAQYTEGKRAAELAHANSLPGGLTLQDVVSPELHARIEKIARIYGVTEPLENLSPAEVGNRFANASLKTLNLRVVPLQISVEALARKAKVRVTTHSTPEPDLAFDVRLQVVRDNALAVCPLELVVQLLEDGGTGLRSLANAWAVGDIRDLRRLVPEYGLFTDGYRSAACSVADPRGHQRSNEYLSKRTVAWLAEAERALRENASTLAVVPMPELFATDGYLAALRERGYAVVEPE